MRSNPVSFSTSALTSRRLPAVVGFDPGAIPTTEPISVGRRPRPCDGRRTASPRWLGIELDTLKVLVLSVVLLGVVSGLV